MKDRRRRSSAIIWLNVLTEMGGDFAGPYGEDMAAIVRDHSPASTVGPVADTAPDGRGLAAAFLTTLQSR